MAGACQTLPQRRSDEAGAGGTAQDGERLLARQQVADRVLVGADGERRREARQQRWVAEALARLEHVDYLIFVYELHRAVADHVEVLRRAAVLDEDGLAGGVGAGFDRRCDAEDLVGLDGVEGSEPGEEASDAGRVGHARSMQLQELLSSSRGARRPAAVRPAPSATPRFSSAIRLREVQSDTAASAKRGPVGR